MAARPKGAPPAEFSQIAPPPEVPVAAPAAGEDALPPALSVNNADAPRAAVRNAALDDPDAFFEEEFEV